MSDEINQKLLIGSVFMDNTTLHEASLKGLRPSLLNTGISSLAQLVDAIVLHERIYVAEDLLKWDEAAKEIADQLKGIIFPFSLTRTQLEQIFSETDELLSEASIELRGSPLWAIVATAISDSDVQEPDIIYVWNKIDSLSVSLRTFHGTKTRKGQSWNDFKLARIARTLLYYLLSHTFNIPYVPNSSRTPLLLQIARILGPPLRDPTSYVMKVIQEIRQHYAEILTDAFGIPAIRIEVPLFFGLSVESARTVEDVISNAKRIRNREHVCAFRKWCSELSKNFIAKNINRVIATLLELETLKSDLFQSLKTTRSLPISLGFPPSISIDVSKIIKRKMSLWFLYDLIELSLQLRRFDNDIYQLMRSINE